MTRMVKCVKLGKEAPGLDYPTYPGELGKKIFENVSKEAWQLWLSHQTMLINEYRISPLDPKARKFIETEMDPDNVVVETYLNGQRRQHGDRDRPVLYGLAAAAADSADAILPRDRFPGAPPPGRLWSCRPP